jgi:hypothetical protein
MDSIPNESLHLRVPNRVLKFTLLACICAAVMFTNFRLIEQYDATLKSQEDLLHQQPEQVAAEITQQEHPVDQNPERIAVEVTQQEDPVPVVNVSPITTAPTTISPTNTAPTSSPATTAPATSPPVTSAPATTSPTNAPVSMAPVTTAPVTTQPEQIAVEVTQQEDHVPVHQQPEQVAVEITQQEHPVDQNPEQIAVEVAQQEDPVFAVTTPSTSSSVSPSTSLFDPFKLWSRRDKVSLETINGVLHRVASDGPCRSRSLHFPSVSSLNQIALAIQAAQKRSKKVVVAVLGDSVAADKEGFAAALESYLLLSPLISFSVEVRNLAKGGTGECIHRCIIS